ncbi:MAG: glycerophosphodiester phosphodiesterase [Okeania sp. SIO2H7]|nr:glycerophosphodiester phosphodiesterase [Okeania sp. SIO2H7]
MNKLEIIAHRGFSAIAPENTKAAFLAAIENGADSLEFDVQFSADGVPVIFHDFNLDRTTNGKGKLREKNLAELKKLDAGMWFDRELSGEEILTLEEGLEILKAIHLFLYFDLKSYSEWSQTEVEKFVEIVMNSEVKEKAVITSFNENLKEGVREISGDELNFGYLVANESSYQTQLAKAVEKGDRLISSSYNILLENPTLIEQTKSKGIDVVAWTVDNPEEFQQLIDLGITRIITNSLIGQLTTNN